MGQPAAATARIETQPLPAHGPGSYQVTAVLEPARRVKIVAPVNGLIRSVDARLGGAVRESHELVQFDPTEANARLRIATAELNEKKAKARQPTCRRG